MTDQTIIEQADELAAKIVAAMRKALLQEYNAEAHDEFEALTLTPMLVAALQSSAVLPSEASDGGYIAAFYDLAKMMGIGARTDAPKVVWEREMRPRLFAMLRAATPTAPVQDDDAELVARLRRHAIYATGHVGEGHKKAFDEAADRIEALSPTPETGLVEVLRNLKNIVLCAEDDVTVEQLRGIMGWRKVSLSNVSRLED